MGKTYLKSLPVWGFIFSLYFIFEYLRLRFFYSLTGYDVLWGQALTLPLSLAGAYLLTFAYMRRKKVYYSSAETWILGTLWMFWAAGLRVLWVILRVNPDTGITFALLKDYDITAGHFWPIFLLALFIFPRITYARAIGAYYCPDMWRKG